MHLNKLSLVPNKLSLPPSLKKKKKYQDPRKRHTIPTPEGKKKKSKEKRRQF